MTVAAKRSAGAPFSGIFRWKSVLQTCARSRSAETAPDPDSYGFRQCRSCVDAFINLVIRYADDFIVTGVNKSIPKDSIKPAIKAFLAERGLQLSKEKTKITRIDRGFDFPGQNYRRYGGKLLIKPSRDNMRAFPDNIRKTIRKGRSLSASALTGDLNPKIRGWANCHRHIVAGRAFGRVDNYICFYLRNRMKRKHPKKNKAWLVRKYRSDYPSPRTFSESVTKSGKTRHHKLIRAHKIGIRRHVKIRGDANPSDPEFDKYFANRMFERFKTRRADNMKLKEQPGHTARVGL